MPVRRRNRGLMERMAAAIDRIEARTGSRDVAASLVARTVAEQLAGLDGTARLDVACPRLRALFASMAAWEPALAGELQPIRTPELVTRSVGENSESLARRDGAQALRAELPPGGDPVLSFYEQFLASADRSQRKRAGVFYTPPALAAFIVRELDGRLRNDAGFDDGLADPRVGVLDPAAGTGTFLVEVVRSVAGTLRSENGVRNGRTALAENLLPRLTACELLPAACAVAEVRLRMVLVETGASLDHAPPLRLFWTDSLSLQGAWRDRTYAAILGNPPFGLGGTGKRARRDASNGDADGQVCPSHESHAEIERLMQPVRDAVAGERNRQPLSDAYVKFLVLAAELAREAGPAVLGMVVNRSCFDGRLHAGLRSLLANRFPRMSLVDLGGETRDGRSTGDQNVFAITQGIGVILGATDGRGTFRSLEGLRLRGTRSEKLSALSSAPQWERLRGAGTRSVPSAGRESPDALADGTRSVPATVVEQLLLQESSQAWRWMRPPGVQVVPGLEDEYAAFPSLCELMPFRSPGVKTSRDAVAFAFTREELESQVRAAGWGWDPGRAIRSLYRPGDVRWLYYDPARLGRPRPDLARHVLPDELSLIATRQYVGDEFSHVAVCRGLACHGVFYLGNRGQDYLFPRTLNGQSGRRPNLEPGRLPESLQDPGRLMAYVAAVLLDPAYRTRYRELLPHDFPRIPISPDPAIVERMCRWGTKWIGWQLWQQGMAPPPGEVSEGVALRSTAFEEPARVGRRGFPRFDEGRVMLAEETWLGPVNNDTWNTRIGGYRVCETFWKSRRGRAVFEEDLESFRRLIQVLVRTRELQRRIAACGRTPLDSPSPPG